MTDAQKPVAIKALSAHTSRPFALQLTIQWRKANPITLVGDALEFPADIPAEPGVYRIMTMRPGTGIRVYIGETANLRTRAKTHARIPNADKNASPNRRLNTTLRNTLSRKGAAQYQVAKTAIVGAKGSRAIKLDMRKQFDRELVEAAAIVREQMRREVLNTERIA